MKDTTVLELKGAPVATSDVWKFYVFYTRDAELAPRLSLGTKLKGKARRGAQGRIHYEMIMRCIWVALVLSCGLKTSREMLALRLRFSFATLWR
jgi:hypothetical protein